MTLDPMELISRSAAAPLRFSAVVREWADPGAQTKIAGRLMEQAAKSKPAVRPAPARPAPPPAPRLRPRPAPAPASARAPLRPPPPPAPGFGPPKRALPDESDGRPTTLARLPSG
jgi:hypothetical protein